MAEPLDPFEVEVEPFEVPLTWPLPLAAASGSQEGHMVGAIAEEDRGAEVWIER